MKKVMALAAVVLSIIPAASFAAASHKAKAAPSMYVCQKCHMKFKAAQAKKDHFADPMDGGKLVPISTTAAKKTMSAKPMGGMKM